MNTPADSVYPDDWLRIARRDWRRVEVALSGEDGGLAAFLLEQCLEKYLKAFLLKRGWRLRRTHQLAVLLDEGVAFDRSLEQFRDLCERVSGYYLVERYPLLSAPPLDVNQVASDVAEAKAFIQALHPGEPE